METKEPTNKPLKKGKTLLLFDIDGTLTAARQNMKQNMYDCLKKASTYEDIDLATVGGSDLPKAKEQLQSAIDLLKFVFTENGLVYLDEKKELHKVDKVTNFLGFEKYKELLNKELSKNLNSEISKYIDQLNANDDLEVLNNRIDYLFRHSLPKSIIKKTDEYIQDRKMVIINNAVDSYKRIKKTYKTTTKKVVDK